MDNRTLGQVAYETRIATPHYRLVEVMSDAKKTHGQVAYETHIGTYPSHYVLQTWDQMTEEMRNRWEKTADAVASSVIEMVQAILKDALTDARRNSRCLGTVQDNTGKVIGSLGPQWVQHDTDAYRGCWYRDNETKS